MEKCYSLPTKAGRVIAPDLIGFGRSGKPEIEYTFEEHYDYLSAFFELMGLKEMVLVVHDWGSSLGFHYAYLNADKIKGITFMEAMGMKIWDHWVSCSKQ